MYVTEIKTSRSEMFHYNWLKSEEYQTEKDEFMLTTL